VPLTLPAPITIRLVVSRPLTVSEQLSLKAGPSQSLGSSHQIVNKNREQDPSEQLPSDFSYASAFEQGRQAAPFRIGLLRVSEQLSSDRESDYSYAGAFEQGRQAAPFRHSRNSISLCSSLRYWAIQAPHGQHSQTRRNQAPHCPRVASFTSKRFTLPEQPFSQSAGPSHSFICVLQTRRKQALHNPCAAPFRQQIRLAVSR